MNHRSGQIPAATIIVASIFALMFIGTITFFVYQFQKGSKPKTNSNTANSNKSTNSQANQNTNTSVTVDLKPLAEVPEAWVTYASTLAPYALRYPDDWTLEEVIVATDPIQKVPVRYVRLSDPTGQVVLSLGMRKVGETTGVGDRLSAPTGTLKDGLTLDISGVDVAGKNLVDGEKIVAIFYYPLSPFGYAYVQGYEMQAEINFIAVPGVKQPLTDLSTTSLTQVAHTILSSLAFTSESTATPEPPVTDPPLGQYRTESYRLAGEAPDTRLINTDGGVRTIVIDSTNAVARLPENYGLTGLVYPAFGTYVYLQKTRLVGSPVRTDIWSYNVVDKTLNQESAFPPVGYGKIVVSPQKNKAVYVSSVDTTDSGYIRTIYYFDLVKKTVETLLTLPEDQSFSAGWGGINNSYSIAWKTNSIVRYSSFTQNSGNKQTKKAKDRAATGEVAIPQR